VREVGLRDADDTAIWEYAKQHDLVIISKDSDFKQRSLLYGSPPKFVWIRLGNCSVHAIEVLLRKHSITLHTFAQNPQLPILILP
jgi:predicted nuclease of predicted toxin-antitoxin system